MAVDQIRPYHLATSIAILTMLLLGATDIAQAGGGAGGSNRSAAASTGSVKPTPPRIPITNGPIKPLPPRLTITNGPAKQPTPIKVGCGGGNPHGSGGRGGGGGCIPAFPVNPRPPFHVTIRHPPPPP